MKWLIVPALGIGVFLGVTIEHSPDLPVKEVTVWEDDVVPNMNHGDTLNIQWEKGDLAQDQEVCDNMGGILDFRYKVIVICRDVDF